MNTLFILNDPPYGTERSFNGLRLATSLAKRAGETVRIFLMGDAASVAKAGQQVPQGYYHLERMLKAATLAGAEVAVCGSCMDARGLTDAELTDVARRSTLAELTDWTQWADRVVPF
ncbi:MAG: DsrE family protein [Gemmatimonadales bacterium]